MVDMWYTEIILLWKGAETMTEAERQDAKKSMAYDLKLIFKEKQNEETFKQTEAIIDAYIAGMQQ